MDRRYAFKTLRLGGFVALLALSCTPTIVTVNSVPDGADVIKVSSAGNRTTLGKTPMKVDLNQALDGGEQALHLVVGKTDFVNQSVMVPKTLGPAQHDFVVHLAEQPQLASLLGRGAAECPKLPEDMIVQVTRTVAEAQGLIASRNYPDAATKLTVMSTQYPNISVLHDLLGNVHFLQRNFDEALKSYERSMLLDPQNFEAARMVRKVRGLMGLPEQKVGH